MGPQGPQGPAGLLSNGTQLGNTPYWDGTDWVLNNNRIYNDGLRVGIGTSTPTVAVEIVGPMKYTDGTEGSNKVLTSDAAGKVSWTKFISGHVNIGDVASGISTSVAGDILTATKSNSGSSSTITVTFPAQNGTSYAPIISLVSLGTADDDNDVETPVILNQTSTSIEIFLNETNGTTQDLRINIVLMPF